MVYEKSKYNFDFSIDVMRLNHTYGPKKPNIFEGDAEMEKNAAQQDMPTYEETNAAIYEVVCELLKRDVNAGCIAACLTQHATRLSFAACDDATLIFETILGSMLRSIPEREEEFDEGLSDQITHQPVSILAS